MQRDRGERALARAIHRYLALAARGGSWMYLDAHGGPIEAGRVTRTFSEVRHDGPIVATYWVADACLLGMLPVVRDELREVLLPIRFIFDDTTGGRVSARIVERLGGHSTILALPGKPERLHQLRSIMDEGGSCAFAVDGGGPYGEVATGVVGFAATLGASILPLTVHARPALSLMRQPALKAPLPHARRVMVIGSRLPIEKGTDRRVAALELKQSLDSLARVADRALAAKSDDVGARLEGTGRAA